MPTLEPFEMMQLLNSVGVPRDWAILTPIMDGAVWANEVCSLPLDQ